MSGQLQYAEKCPSWRGMRDSAKIRHLQESANALEFLQIFNFLTPLIL